MIGPETTLSVQTADGPHAIFVQVFLTCDLLTCRTTEKNRGSIPCQRQNVFCLRDIRNDSGVHPASYSVGTGDDLPRGKAITACNHLHLVPKLRMSGVSCFVRLYERHHMGQTQPCCSFLNPSRMASVHSTDL